MSVNKVILVGNVGKDPETRYLDENTPVCKFPLATSEVYRNRDGEKVEQTEWHNVVLWRGLAKVAEQYVKKGSQLYIEGRIKSRSYDDKDGVKRYTTEIVGDNMQMLSRQSTGDSQQSAEGGQQYSAGGQQSGASGQSAVSSQQSSAGSQQAPGGGQQSSAGSQPAPGASGAAGNDQDATKDPSADLTGPGNEPDDLPF